MPDVLASIRYDDEQMAARFCAKFSKLGTTQTGSYALGQTLADFFALAQEAVAKHYADVTNEHVIEDLIDIDYGIDAVAPLIKFETETDRRYAVADLAALVMVGALTPDPELEAYLRAEGDLPELVEHEEPEETEVEEAEPTPIRPAARSRIKSQGNAEATSRNDRGLSCCRRRGIGQEGRHPPQGQRRADDRRWRYHRRTRCRSRYCR